MNPEPTRAPLPPFFTALRRRHPEVDIVLLPPEPPHPDEPVDDGAVAAAVQRVDTITRDLWAQIDPAGSEPTVRVAFGADEDSVVARGRGSTRVPDGHQVLSALRERLAVDGWRLHRPEGGVTRLVGRLDELVLRASYAEARGALLVEVSGASLPVGRDRARMLVGRS